MTKRQVEAMQRVYDNDPVAALTHALRIALDAPDATWEQLLAHRALSHRSRELTRREERALDQLFADLTELRGVGP